MGWWTDTARTSAALEYGRRHHRMFLGLHLLGRFWPLLLVVGGALVAVLAGRSVMAHTTLTLAAALRWGAGACTVALLGYLGWRAYRPRLYERSPTPAFLTAGIVVLLALSFIV